MTGPPDRKDSTSYSSPFAARLRASQNRTRRSAIELNPSTDGLTSLDVACSTQLSKSFFTRQSEWRAPQLGVRRKALPPGPSAPRGISAPTYSVGYSPLRAMIHRTEPFPVCQEDSEFGIPNSPTPVLRSTSRPLRARANCFSSLLRKQISPKERNKPSWFISPSQPLEPRPHRCHDGQP